MLARSVAFFLALVLLTVAAGFVAAPVHMPRILAAINAGLADPLKQRIDRLIGQRRKLSAAATFLRVSRATLKGTFVIGGIQGIIGGVLFWVLGLPVPLAFGVLFALLAAIPSFGAILIWLSAFFDSTGARAGETPGSERAAVSRLHLGRS